jgi:hypothetical protein
LPPSTACPTKPLDVSFVLLAISEQDRRLFLSLPVPGAVPVDAETGQQGSLQRGRTFAMGWPHESGASSLQGNCSRGRRQEHGEDLGKRREKAVSRVGRAFVC